MHENIRGKTMKKITQIACLAALSMGLTLEAQAFSQETLDILTALKSSSCETLMSERENVQRGV